METHQPEHQQANVPVVDKSTTPDTLAGYTASETRLEDSQPPSLSEPVSPIIKNDALALAKTNRGTPHHTQEIVNQNDNKAHLYSSATTQKDIETDETDQYNENEVRPRRRTGWLDFVCGLILGSIIGPFSLLFVVCWRGMAIEDTRRTRFLMGCSVGIIAQIMGLAIVYSVLKLKSRQIS